MRNRLNSFAARFVGVLVVAFCGVAQAATYRVTADAAGGGDGSSWTSPMTLNEAIAAAANDDVILCQAGTYPTVAGSGKPSSSFQIAKPLTIRGGLKGTDDTTLNETSPLSTFKAPAVQVNIFYVSSGSGTNVFENLKLSGVTANSRYYVFSAINKTGAGSIEVRNCQIVNNYSGGDSCSYGQGLNLSGGADSTAVISNCLFAGNVCTSYAKDGGQALRLVTFKEVTLTDCPFVTNGVALARGWSNLSGNGAIRGAAIYAKNAPIKAKNCSFLANRCTWLNGVETGCVMLDGEGGETTFENCSWLGNSEIFGQVLNASYGYAATAAKRGGAIVASFTSNESLLTLKNCTVAMNQTDSPGSAAGVTVLQGKLKVFDSIIANNIRPGYAAAPADLMVAGTAEVVLSNVQLSANAPSSVVVGANGANPPVRSGLRFGDPLFNTALSDITDCLSSAISKTYNHPYFTTASLPTLLAIDCGLTAASSALGLGAKVVTDPAIPTGTPSFGSVTITFPEPYSDPCVTVTMAGVSAYLAEVRIDVKVGGTVRTSKTFCSIRSSDTLTFSPPLGLSAGDAVSVEATATVPGVTPVKDTSASGTVPSAAVQAPWIGVAGAANVIYVRAGADGAGTGRNWADAFTDLETAFASLSAARTQIWIAGSLAAGAGIRHTTPAASFAVLGGFTGGEASAAARPADGSRAIVDFAAVKSGITIANGADIKATFDRIEFRNTSEGAIVKSGAGDIDVTNCRFLNCSDDSTCSAGQAYGGDALRISGTSDTQATVANCSFEGCMSYRDKTDTRGLVLHATTLGKLELTDCLFLTNGVSWSPYRNNLNNIGVVFNAVYVSGVPVVATRCHFVGNRVTTRGTAASFYLNGACGGSVFDRCLWTANAATWTGVNSPGDHAATAALVLSLANATDEVDVKGCTFAYNLIDGSKGSGGLSVVKGKANISNSIFLGNGRSPNGTGGNDLSLQSSGSADIVYSLFTAKPGTYDSITAVTADSLAYDSSVLFLDDGYDPQFVTPLMTAQGYFTTIRTGCRCFKEADKAAVCGFDLHIKSPGGYWLNNGTSVTNALSATSAALDTGDPNADYSKEPKPNGSRVNMGAYGNTPEAAMTASVNVEIDAVRTTYPSEWSRPHIEVDMGGSSGYSALVQINCYTGGVLVVSRSFPNAACGDTVVWNPAIYFTPADQLTVKVIASAQGSEDVYAPDCKSEVAGAVPLWSGKGGGTGVIHVRVGADGDATGLNWTDAYPTLESVTNLYVLGELPATYREIWLSGSFVRSCEMAKIQPKGSLAVRGGFDGHENAPEDRANVTAQATIDGNFAYPGLQLVNGASATALVERIVFTRGTDLGLRKEGSGNITVRGCQFRMNRRINPWSNVVHLGHGAGADLVGSSGSTRVVVTNCVFEGNTYSTGCGDHGCGLYLETVHRATITDCSFYTNGIPWSATVLPYSGYSLGVYGAAIYANGSPVEMTRCRFVANRSNPTAGEDGAGGTVTLFGNCNGSTFDHCLWMGNEDAWGGYYNNWCASIADSGALQVRLDAKEQTVTLRSCTIAYNYADRAKSGAGVVVSKGTVNIVDSILYGNFGGTVTGAGVGRDLTLISSNAVANVRYSLLGTPDGLSASSLDPANLSTNAAEGVIFGDPLFVTQYAAVTNLLVSQGADRYSNTPHHRFSDAGLAEVMAFNVHLRGRVGYVDEKTGERIRFRGRSPAVDAGDPASPYANEPELTFVGCNGRRVNLGFYGNTPWATMTRIPGSFLRVR